MMESTLKPLRVCRGCGLKAYTSKDLELFKTHKNRPFGQKKEDVN